MFKDLRHGARMLLHAKGWTAVVVVSLALGIGANTALFSAANGLLLKKLPVDDPDSLVRLRWVGRNDMATDSSDYGYSSRTPAGLDVHATFSYPMFRQFLADNRTMTDLFACAPYGRVNVVVDGQAEIGTAFISSGNYYRLLGVDASPGRTIIPEDDQPAAPPVAVISHRYWRSRFGGDPQVVGKTIRINNLLVTIIGVLSPAFRGIQQPSAIPPDVAVPLAVEPQLNARQSRLTQPTDWWLQIAGRVRPGVSTAQVQGNLEGVFQHTARAGLESYLASISEEARSTSVNRSRTNVPRLMVDSGSRGIYDVNASDLRVVAVLSVVVGLVLLIVCANVANLLLSRATTRQKEISIRLSMGATRARLIRQLLTESLLLASLGGVLGVVVAYWGKQLLPGAPGQATAVDWRVLSFVLAVTAVTGIVFGIAPALRATGVNVSSAMKENSRSIAASRSILGKSLLIVQVAVSLVLLIGAGLFLRTLQNLRHVDVGFNPDRLVLFRVNPQLNRYDEKRIRLLYQTMMERLGAAPGVRAVALSQPALLSGSISSTSIFVRGRSYQPGHHDGIHRVVVSPSFFETMEMPLLAGRGFTPRDDESGPKVVVINEAAARKYFPTEDPIGHRFGSSIEDSGQLEIVGVLRDAKYNSVRDPAPPTMYVPYMQRSVSGVVFEVRTAGDPVGAMGGIREAVRQVDPNLPLMDMSTQMEQVEGRFLQEKLFAHAYTLFGGLAVSLAAVGLFGLMSYSVARRTNEIGIRMALGADRRHVLGLVLTESLVLVLIGLGLGVGIAMAAGRFVAAVLFGLAATDAGTMLLAVTAMMLVSAVAGYLPARRATRVDPMVALRYE